MKLSPKILLLIAVIIVASTFKIYADTVQVTSYYPAPKGYYDKVSVNQKLIIPCYEAGYSHKPTDSGSMWIEDSTGTVQGCKGW